MSTSNEIPRMSRVIAAIVDMLILGPVIILTSNLINSDTSRTIIQSLISLTFTFYRIGAHHLFGQTLGKYITHIKVIDGSTKTLRISLARSLQRDSPLLIFGIRQIILMPTVLRSTESIALLIGAIFVLIAVLWYATNLWIILFASSGLTYYDRWCGTTVVRVSTASANTEQRL